MWFHTAWRFLLMFLPTEYFSIHIFFLVMNMVSAKFDLPAGALLSECRKTQFLSMEEETFCLPMTHRNQNCQNAEKHSFYPWKRKHSVCQWHIEVVAGAVGPTISDSCSTGSVSRNDTTNVANVPKLPSLTDTSILTMIFTRYICVLTRDLNDDNPWCA